MERLYEVKEDLLKIRGSIRNHLIKNDSVIITFIKANKVQTVYECVNVRLNEYDLKIVIKPKYMEDSIYDDTDVLTVWDLVKKVIETSEYVTIKEMK